MTLARHDLLLVRPECWAGVLARAHRAGWQPGAPALQPQARKLVAGWAEQGWPVIVRRLAACETSPLIAVGLPLPPSLGKQRIALEVAPQEVLDSLAGVHLGREIGSLPPRLAPQLGDVLDLAHACGVAPRIFGALLWQHLTGLEYVHGGSDIDLLWPLGEATDRNRLLGGLTAIDETGPARIDGEILLASGRAVNWRELRDGLVAGAEGTVMVKTLEGVRLECLQTLFN
ncbi:phosphoribosyl-dephospho-CoA transferase [Hartmannibacter diazotrophicus]|uniref:Phosphoribosyl-dephospho-CoA transferase n=1 Tax=Hartmannibacter diazotrophicus TaxID=1482074 RepID=A0A2C9D1B2_9HYPH|nr:malonate decarboxylase holo-[acyl-carrier-protein] synthase [Hartmannibacter diazotrophicus]SON54036.1 phosphoribosyl-dephospho-CoA transferase [Hartmannibacter diazotrophicus]